MESVLITNEIIKENMEHARHQLNNMLITNETTKRKLRAPLSLT